MLGKWYSLISGFKVFKYLEHAENISDEEWVMIFLAYVTVESSGNLEPESPPVFFLILPWGHISTEFYFYFFKDFIYLFSGRGEGRVKERRETLMCERYIDHLPLACPPNWGPGLQPQHVPWLGIELVTLRFTDRRSIHWATPVKVPLIFRGTSIGFLLYVPQLGMEPST